MSHPSNPNRAMHGKIELHRGKASEYACVVGEEDHDAYDWSHIHDTDRDDVYNYRPMCRKHHNEYDWTPERAEAARERMKGNTNRRGAKLSEETKRKISESKRKK